MHEIYQLIRLVKNNSLIELGKLWTWKLKEKRKEKPAVDLLLLHFCLVRIRNILVRLGLFLFCDCSRTIDSIVSLLFSAQMLSTLNEFLHKEKCVGWYTLARNYILHLRMTQAKLKTMNKKTRQIFKKFCCLPYHVLPTLVGAIHIYIFVSTLC